MQTNDDPDISERSTGSTADTAGQSTDTARTEKLLYEEKTKSIVAAFYAVYDELGYGFLESVYCSALAFELHERGHKIAREFAVPVFYRRAQVAKYRIDLVVDACVVLEIKSTEVLNPADKRQLLNCLRATPLEVGLLLHFGPRAKFFRFYASNEFRRP